MILSIILIGLSAGLRAMTPPAIVAWGAYLGCISLDTTPFAFISSPISVAILSLFALAEYVVDLLPTASNRTAPLGLIARIVTGAFSAACLLTVTGGAIFLAIIGSATAVIGAHAGMYARVGLIKKLGVKDVFVAIPEDLISIAIAASAVCIGG